MKGLVKLEKLKLGDDPAEKTLWKLITAERAILKQQFEREIKELEEKLKKLREELEALQKQLDEHSNETEEDEF